MACVVVFAEFIMKRNGDIRKCKAHIFPLNYFRKFHNLLLHRINEGRKRKTQ